MFQFKVLFFVFSLSFSVASFISKNSREKLVSDEGADVGEPLHLTPYIESGRIAEGRKLSVVPPLVGNVVSYSGFLTVNKTTGSNIFFWFFPCEHQPWLAPVALWLQGGPGSSSMFAVFKENGPFKIKKHIGIGKKLHHWTQTLNVIYIDQPVGTGFSYTESGEGYAKNEEDVARDLYEALQQFFTLFPGYRAHEFFITGESYAGKYIPALGYAIHERNPTAEKKINLKGLAIGDGWVDPVNMLNYANLLFMLGFIDSKTHAQFSARENHIKTLIINKKYHEAFSVLDQYIDGDVSKTTEVSNVTGIVWLYNFLHPLKQDNDPEMQKYLNQPFVRKAIHVGNITFNDQNNDVLEHLEVDQLLTIVPKLEVLIDNYRVLLYNGQLDIICAYSLTMNYVAKMRWNGKEDYDRATRHQWYVGKELAGYVKSAGRFTDVLVRNAGHMVPADQPLWALDMITRFTRNEPFKTKP